MDAIVATLTARTGMFFIRHFKKAREAFAEPASDALEIGRDITARKGKTDMQKTGWPPGMLQDDSRELNRWLSTRLGARYQLQRNNMQTNQTPEALLDDDGENRAVRAFLMLYGQQGLTAEKMKAHLIASGFPHWPHWVTQQPGHLTKGGAQLWLRLLFSLEEPDRLRDMAASGAKDAEAATLLRVIQRLNQNPYSLTKSECIDEVNAMRDAAIAATKRGGA